MLRWILWDSSLSHRSVPHSEGLELGVRGRHYTHRFPKYTIYISDSPHKKALTTCLKGQIFKKFSGISEMTVINYKWRTKTILKIHWNYAPPSCPSMVKGEKLKEMHLDVKAVKPHLIQQKRWKVICKGAGAKLFLCRDRRGTRQILSTTRWSNGGSVDWSRLRHCLLKAQHWSL